MTAPDKRKGDFWSRRKAAVEAEAAAERAAAETRAAEAEQAALEERSDAEILAELNLPDPDRLQPGDDVAGFMARAVPDRIRRRALRRLWRLNPVLANVDGLVDYGEDFTDSATVIEGLQTVYAVGKGMVTQLAEPPAPEAVTEDEATEPEPRAEDAPVKTMAEVAAVPDDDDTETETATPAPRRMRFAFEG